MRNQGYGQTNRATPYNAGSDSSGGVPGYNNAGPNNYGGGGATNMNQGGGGGGGGPNRRY